MTREKQFALLKIILIFLILLSTIISLLLNVVFIITIYSVLLFCDLIVLTVSYMEYLQSEKNFKKVYKENPKFLIQLIFGCLEMKKNFKILFKKNQYDFSCKCKNIVNNYITEEKK